MSLGKIIHVISGTHWDREWRYTADQSLLRLVELIDELLDILETNPDYACFHLDGGTIVIEDYLAVRPQNAERLKKLIQQGRIHTVMWYTLPEMSTVSPEALIRNLLIGRRLADQFGGAMKTGYTATSYGQISQLPQIYAGFEMHTAMSYRGTNKHQVPPICKWQGADGTEIYHIRCFDEVTRTNWFFFPHYELVLGKMPRDISSTWNSQDHPVHMADSDLYETAFQLKNESFEFNRDPAAIRKALRLLIAQAEPQAIGEHLLALDMEDNAVPYAKLPEMIAVMNQAQKDCHIQQSSLDDYVDAALAAAKGQPLKTLVGEMRFTAIEAGFNGLLGATHSSRVNLKLMNDLAERELIGLAEPLMALSRMAGGAYESSLLERAWLYLLKNHAHDSICGAAIDLAHQDNPYRFRAATAIARECTRKACEEIWNRINTQGSFEDGDLTLTVFNTQLFSRKSVELLVIDTPRPDFGNFPIEPCTGVGPVVEGFNPDEIITFQYFDIVDESGKPVPYKIIERENIDMEVERKLDSNAAVYSMLRNRVLVEVEVPALGYRTYAVRPRKRQYELEPASKGVRPLIAGPDGTLENAFVRVEIHSNGTFDLTDKIAGKTHAGLHYFVDDSSVGNAHKHKGVLRDYMVTSLGAAADLTLIENNALRATWKVDLELLVPSHAELSSRNRSRDKIALPVTSLITLKKDAHRVDVKTVVDNRSEDHRLRVCLPTDLATDYAYAHAPFDVVKRSILWDDVKDNLEEYHPYKPMQDFVNVTDGKRSLSLMSKGLGEYEVIDDTRRTLAITLLRTTRAYMLANRGLMTPDEYARNTGQHCLGNLEFEYAVCAHEGDWNSAGLVNAALDYRMPMRVIQGIPKPGTMEPSAAFFAVSEPDKIHLSALYYDSHSDATILRLWNSTPEKLEVKVVSLFVMDYVSKVSLDQRRELEMLHPASNTHFFINDLNGYEIATFSIKYKA